MNLKATHLIVLQFGIFIGIVVCLVVWRFESAKPTAAEMRELATLRAAAIDRTSESKDERGDLADNRENPGPDEPLAEQAAYPLPNQYSPEAAEKSMAVITKLYYEQIAPKRPASSIPANTAAVAPAYTEVTQEPAVVQYDDPAPQNVAYVQPTQYVVYPQPVPVVFFSNPRRFVNRCRPAPHPSALASNSHRRRNNGGNQLRGFPESRAARPLGLGQHRPADVRTCPPSQGFASRGKR